MSNVDLLRSYREYAKTMSRRIKRALGLWNETEDGPFWQEVMIKDKPVRYHVITATDFKAFDASNHK